ncbi:uncharacterized protein N7482_004408 [Penicillium canariense]|uniref:Uncharacterized protein n=1 Tax=Penicillium canariense TaxID=189055 RepID=A0A9W9I8P6_9EURO|nr:uncharacterized protein N7482_004408 [Penicillium canariense]KAJ5168814.1 hypothetical protein N7482_004408 [Penicillium canariense]
MTIAKVGRRLAGFTDVPHVPTTAGQQRCHAGFQGVRLARAGQMQAFQLLGSGRPFQSPAVCRSHSPSDPAKEGYLAPFVSRPYRALLAAYDTAHLTDGEPGNPVCTIARRLPPSPPSTKGAQRDPSDGQDRLLRPSTVQLAIAGAPAAKFIGGPVPGMGPHGADHQPPRTGRSTLGLSPAPNTADGGGRSVPVEPTQSQEMPESEGRAFEEDWQCK